MRITLIKQPIVITVFIQILTDVDLHYCLAGGAFGPEEGAAVL